jgi:endonuclease YncB( thermonuclease family)
MPKPGTLARHGWRVHIPLLALVLTIISCQSRSAERQVTAAIGGPEIEAPRIEGPTIEGPTIEGLVTAVADGDTLVVLAEGNVSYRIRLLGIDAPEGGQPYGKIARKALLDLVLRKRVQVRAQSRDPYGRTVGKVLLNGADINLEQVREGQAWHYKHYAGDQFPEDAAVYAQAERDARAAHRGLWNQPDPEAPWEWRRRHPRTP